MLNRRILRAKAMQALFALNQAKISNYHNAIEYFKSYFAPDLNSMEVQDHKKLLAQINAATKSFEQNYLLEQAQLNDNDTRDAVVTALSNYHIQNQKDKKHYGRKMIELAESLAENYILLLLFPIEVCNLITERNDAKQISTEGVKILRFSNKLLTNTYIEIIRNDKQLAQLKSRYNSTWERDIIKQIWTDFVTKDEQYKAYLEMENPTKEEEKSIVQHIYKQCLFKNEIATNYLEEINMLWSEDRSILKSLVSRTIKGIDLENNTLQLLDISGNWEEDKDFFINLFESTVIHEKELEALITPKLKNWDHDRIAITDRIILNMALCEMLYFPSIPTKVTINEYIEISKDYSTPKSKQFINGILDKLSIELTNNGQLRKSGRGLLDNKS